MRKFILLIVLLVLPHGVMAFEEKEASKTVISPATKTAAGFFEHEVTSLYQKGTTKIRVLLPKDIQPKKTYPVVYVLPVEAQDEKRYGQGLMEVQKHNLHNKHQAIFVAPTFSHLPWYADHSTEKTIRQESYFLNEVVPLIDKHYPASPKMEDRLLLGFSKSGWGAWSLLLRHPKMFGRAVAWDAPLMMQQLGQYGTRGIYATQENFEKYRITDLLKTWKGENAKRLILIGEGNFQKQHVEIHQLMQQLHIPHIYKEGEKRKHDWHSGWVMEAVPLLFER